MPEEHTLQLFETIWQEMKGDVLYFLTQFSSDSHGCHSHHLFCIGSDGEPSAAPVLDLGLVLEVFEEVKEEQKVILNAGSLYSRNCEFNRLLL